MFIILLLLLFVLFIWTFKQANGKVIEESFSDLFLKAPTTLYLPYRYQTSSLSQNPFLMATRGQPSDSWIKEVILQTAREHNIDESLFLKIAFCESNLKPQAKNPFSTASGIFQFLNSTFFKYAQAYNLPTKDKNDVFIQTELAAKMIRDGGLKHWWPSKNCWLKI